MRYAIPITEDTQEFIGKFLNNGVVPEVEEQGTLFVFSDDPEYVPSIVPSTYDIWEQNNNQFKFIAIPVWVFQK